MNAPQNAQQVLTERLLNALARTTEYRQQFMDYLSASEFAGKREHYEALCEKIDAALVYIAECQEQGRFSREDKKLKDAKVVLDSTAADISFRLQVDGASFLDGDREKTEKISVEKHAMDGILSGLAGFAGVASGTAMLLCTLERSEGAETARG